VLGAITATRAAGNEIAVKAHKHANRSDPESVEMKVIRTGNAVVICALYPTPSDDDEENECTTGERHRNNVRDNDVEVEFSVEVPDGIELVASTVVGDVDAQGLGGDVTAKSVTGRITVTSSGEVSAATVSGDIRARMAARKPVHDLDFKTVSGDITLEVPAQFEADVRLRSQFGNVDSDFGLEVERSRFGHSSRGRIGRGGATVYASTLSGRIELVRM